VTQAEGHPASGAAALAGRVALVTGASGGIGQAVGARLAAEGARVALGYGTSEAPARELAARIAAAGGQSVAIGADLRDPGAPAALIAAAEDALGPVDVLVANAGLGRRQSLDGVTSDASPGATLGVLTGRRRQGKTFLLRALCEAAGGFYFAAGEATDGESLQQIGAAVGAHLQLPAPLRFDGWHAAIDALLSLGADRPLPVVIDEFPYLVQAHPALPSIVQNAIAPRRAEREGSRSRLLLCGSAMTFMGGLLPGTRHCAGEPDSNSWCRRSTTSWRRGSGGSPTRRSRSRCTPSWAAPRRTGGSSRETTLPPTPPTSTTGSAGPC
jgi:NAD(P)-dependent dehydrogenase (short-subunit alcohol dehydrogenase family)